VSNHTLSHNNDCEMREISDNNGHIRDECRLVFEIEKYTVLKLFETNIG
jgi:hypothetical protein